MFSNPEPCIRQMLYHKAKSSASDGVLCLVAFGKFIDAPSKILAISTFRLLRGVFATWDLLWHLVCTKAYKCVALDMNSVLLTL